MLDYNKLAKSYDELHYKEQLEKVNLIIKELKIKSENILDVGWDNDLLKMQLAGQFFQG